MKRKQAAKSYIFAIIAVGAMICLFSAYHLPTKKVDVYLALLALITLTVGARVAVRLPRLNTNVTVDDTFIFLTLLLYGGEAAVLLAAASGCCSAFRVSKKPRIIMFAGAALSCAIFVTSQVLTWAFGDLTSLVHQHGQVIVLSIGLMGLVQYFVHTGIVAVANALKDNQGVWHMWSQNFLWISVTYFIGAATAALIALTVGTAGFYALLVAVPIIGIVYFSYHRYLNEIRQSVRQAELAERARAELAEKHVQELNKYIAEQDRISRALEEAKDHFRHAAFHDALTGLPNRAMFTEILAAKIETSKHRHDGQFAVLFLDLDRFKTINDSLGHTHGDLLLVYLARRLEGCLRTVDSLARLGGDEFAILLNNVEDCNEAIQVAERIQQEIAQPFNLDQHSAFASASIGIAMSTTGYTDQTDILRDADTAMYWAKENGKARYEVFDEKMHARAVSRLRLEGDLRQAIEQEQFCIYYQPIVSLETGNLTGFEALVRWQHPEKGIVSPAEFIPLAEETGLVVPIGIWVLEEACRQMHEWTQKSTVHRKLKLSVNLSSRQVAQAGLAEQITEILRKTSFDPHCLNLEITETVVMENDEIAAELFKTLRALGIRLSIDDFGTGYSSLSCLHRFPVHYLKIDRSFVSQMEQGGENVEIVRTITALAHNSGMEVIAEGIETAEQMRQLHALKCEYGQGYFYSQPLDEKRTEELILDSDLWSRVCANGAVISNNEPVALLSEVYSM
jgi:diguanylate cyclase (GGDEF)-like protein